MFFVGALIGFFVGTIAGFALAAIFGANERNEDRDRINELLAFCNRCSSTHNIDRSGHPEER